MAKRKKDNNEDAENPNLNSSDDSADNFGLPDIEYKPLDRTEPEVRETFIEPEPVAEVHKEEIIEEETTTNYYEEEEATSKAPVIIGIIIVIVVLVAGFLVYKYWLVPRQQQEKAKQEQAARDKAAEAKRIEDERLAQEAADAEKKRLAAEALKAVPAVGTIETLTDRTRRYYVVLSSDIDDDLIMDYAKRLSAKGVSTKIVPPYGSTKFFRLAMSVDHASYAEAQAAAEGAKAEYNAPLWVLFY